MQDKPKESDWRSFRDMVPTLREKYLQSRNKELGTILDNKEISPTEQFWEIEERTQEIAKILRNCLDGHSRSKMEFYIGLMLHHEMMKEEDLTAFSPELRERLKQRMSL